MLARTILIDEFSESVLLLLLLLLLILLLLLLLLRFIDLEENRSSR